MFSVLRLSLSEERHIYIFGGVVHIRKTSDSFSIILALAIAALTFFGTTVFDNLAHALVMRELEKYLSVEEAQVIVAFSKIAFSLFGSIIIVSGLYIYLRRELNATLKPKLQARFDPLAPSCDAIVRFRDGTKSRCIRLKVENTGTSRLLQCEGWLEIREFFRLSPAKLFWVAIPEAGSVDLTKGISRFLQVFRIHESNVVIPATYANPPEQWPIELQNRFVPGKYLFTIGLKGQDEAETVFCNLELNWTGDWATAQVA